MRRARTPPATERPHRRASDLEALSCLALVDLLLAEEQRAVEAVRRERRVIAAAAGSVAETLGAGGRLIYAGAGTSGRLGVLDAAELPPTFGSDPRRVVAVIAGGRRAIGRSVEGAEDRPVEARRALERLGVGPFDLLCAVAASGTTPFTLAALAEARRRGARTVLVTCVRDPRHRRLADRVIAVEVGPEIVAGSTRLKGGTATKLVLNAISTTAMVRLGKVFRGRMVDMVASNAKLHARGRRIVEELGGVSAARAAGLITAARGDVKLALAAALLTVPLAEARRMLEAAEGRLQRLPLPRPTRRERRRLSRDPRR